MEFLTCSGAETSTHCCVCSFITIGRCFCEWSLLSVFLKMANDMMVIIGASCQSKCPLKVSYQNVDSFIEIFFLDKGKLIIWQSKGSSNEPKCQKRRFLSEFLQLEALQDNREKEHAELPEFMAFV